METSLKLTPLSTNLVLHSIFIILNSIAIAVVPIVNESTLFSKNYREQHPTGIIREEFTSHDHGLENNEGAFAEAQEKADKSLNGLDLTEFKLRFKQSALLFHYADDVSKVPIYLKGSVLFITLLEKLHQTFRGNPLKRHHLTLLKNSLKTSRM